MKEQQPIQDEMETGVKEELENVDTDNVTDAGTPEEDVQEEAAGDQEQVLDDETEKLKAEIEEHKQRLLRTQADYDNFRRRTVKEKEELGKYASAKLIAELLPVIDNFERALGSVPDVPEAASYAKGVEMIFRQLEGVLKAEGLVAMESVGTPFNPEYHQAIMQVESDEYEEGDVVEEVQKGYMLKDKVLRPAMVKVKG